MKKQEAKQYIQAITDSLGQLNIRASVDNVGYLAGVFQLLSELHKNIDSLEEDHDS